MRLKTRLTLRRVAISAVGLFSASWSKPVLCKTRRCEGRAGGAIPFTSFVTGPWWCGKGVVEVCESLALDGSSHDSFESSYHVIVFRRDQGKRVTGTLGASCSPNAMDVGVRSIG